jgi:hypothetical protein
LIGRWQAPSQDGGQDHSPWPPQMLRVQRQFTVRQGTIFESSHLPLHLWLQVIHLMCASKKGISTNQIRRMLSCSMKTAWFLTHGIRGAVRDGAFSPMGGAGIGRPNEKAQAAAAAKAESRNGMIAFSIWLRRSERLIVRTISTKPLPS